MILFNSQSTPCLLCEKSWEELYHIAPVVVKGLGLRFQLMAPLSSTPTLAHHVSSVAKHRRTVFSSPQ